MTCPVEARLAELGYTLPPSARDGAEGGAVPAG